MTNIIRTLLGLTNTTPSANGTASAGSSSEAARADHVHPLEYTMTTSSKTGITWQIYKFTEGLMIQHGIYTFTWTNASKLIQGSSGAIYIAPAQTIQFGSSFANNQPSIFVTPSANGTVGTLAGYARATTSSLDLYVFTAQTSNVSTQVSIIAIGRWK